MKKIIRWLRRHVRIQRGDVALSGVIFLFVGLAGTTSSPALQNEWMSIFFKTSVALGTFCLGAYLGSALARMRRAYRADKS